MGGEPRGTFRCPRCGGEDTFEVSYEIKPGIWWCKVCEIDFKAWQQCKPEEKGYKNEHNNVR